MLRSKNELDQLKRIKNKKANDDLNISILTKFLSTLEEQKRSQLDKITNEMEKLESFKSQLGIQTNVNLGNKRRA